MAIILGIDPGLRHTGWGVVQVQGNLLKYVACGTISSRNSDPLAVRLGTLSEGVKQVVECYNPCQCAIEETFLNKNPASSLKLGHARGAVMLTVSLAQVTLHEYAATLVKKSIVGVGRADKQQVMMMVKQLLPGAQIASEDAADALAVAICHISHAKAAHYQEKVV